jgi:hypothetical protein
MKSAIIFALAIVPALTGILTAAEPLDDLRVASTLDEAPAKAAAKKPAGAPIGLVVRVYEMDINKLGLYLDFCPTKDDRKTVNSEFEAFRKAGAVKLLAEPHLVTQDGREATYVSGGEVPFIVPTDKEKVTIDYLEYGTRIELTPRRLKQDQVRITISAEFTHPAQHGLTAEEETTPVVVGSLIRTTATLGPKDIVVLNDHEARESDEPGTVIFMTIELADAGVEAALLQFDGEAGEDVLPAPPRDVPARAVPNRSTPSLDLPDAVETGGETFSADRKLSRKVRPAQKNSAASPNGSFYLKPGKTQLELTRGTWRSLTIPSKDFVYGSSLLVESPDDGAVSISGRILTPWEEGPVKSETFEAGGSGEKHAADVWTIKGVKPGIATIRLIDDEDQEYEIEVTVKGDTRHFDAMVKRFHPEAKVEAHELTEQSIVITGEASADDSVAIREIAEQIYATVLLRLKTQPTPEALLDGPFPDPDQGEGASTYPDSTRIAKSETENSEFVPTTQVRFLQFGLISMQTPAEPGSFQKVQSWESWSTWKMSGGQHVAVRYSAHRENVPQGSQTRFQFRTTEFRDDV